MCAPPAIASVGTGITGVYLAMCFPYESLLASLVLKLETEFPLRQEIVSTNAPFFCLVLGDISQRKMSSHE